MLCPAILCLAPVIALSFPPTIVQEDPSPLLREIVETRSIDGLILSPSGSHVAYRVISPSVTSNTTQLQWYSVALDGKSSPIPLGEPQEPLWLPLYDSVEAPQAAWTDEQHIVVRASTPSGIQLVQLGPARAVKRLTNDDADIVTFDLDQAGRVRYATRNRRTQIDQAQRLEELRGVRLDRTVDTDGLRLTRNFRIGERVTTIRRMDASQGIEAYAGPLRTQDLQIAPPPAAKERPPRLTGAGLKVGENPLGEMQSIRVRIVVSEARAGEEAYRRYRLEAVDGNGNVHSCTAAFCSGLTAELKAAVLDRRSGAVILFHEADFAARTAIYVWRPSQNSVREIKAATTSLDAGALFGDNPCPVTDTYAICVEAGPASPPRLVRIDLTTAARVELAAPNAALAAHRLPDASFLRWKDAEGRVSTGILMLPSGMRRALPLVITTYRCRGFLRGGSGWMVAEHDIVQRGMASLCVNNNNLSITDRDETGKRLPLGPHKAALAAYAAIIDQLARAGTIDRTRVGIAGHSFSSMVTAYAISHTDLFAAALSVGNTIDPMHYYITSPTADSFRKYVKPTMGLPLPDEDPSGILAEASPARNAARIRAPLLMETVEAEHLSAFELYTRIQDTGGIVDMYIFPDEGHLGGREPAHIFWRNRRAADWFSFWLTNKEWPGAAAPDQYRLWGEMREKRLARAPD